MKVDEEKKGRRVKNGEIIEQKKRKNRNKSKKKA